MRSSTKWANGKWVPHILKKKMGVEIIVDSKRKRETKEDTVETNRVR